MAMSSPRKNVSLSSWLHSGVWVQEAVYGSSHSTPESDRLEGPRQQLRKKTESGGEGLTPIQLLAGSGPCIPGHSGIPAFLSHRAPQPSPAQSPRLKRGPRFAPYFCNATPTFHSHFILHLWACKMLDIPSKNYCKVGPPPDRAIDIILVSGAPQQDEPGKRISHANASSSAGSSQPRQLWNPESAWKVGENSRKLRETTATGFPCVELTQQEKGQAGAQDSGSPGECAQTRWASTVRPSHKLCSKPVMISTTGWEKAEKQTAAFESQAWGPSLPQFCLNPGLARYADSQSVP
ncbi:hypothetical protein ASPSYDRAFT_34461 [Aspergillus sydowii CBS 593.65]|uniref:Uncharacterized protein n=1 Tax=Aspergillus sydowii CBS 593.65 TaxID=1036612 RepID=A0A1L9T7Y8_9EURO|nr:uncharacterized protein ASPSYDRAFT_34461 [Aspergillus sydowii CBS 593.65]OJJ55538.1 hypothetical protein ASPSYDRAFT_34461 [Aspergillus sydowii CBS 593.65]